MCVNISSITRIFSNQSRYFPDIHCILRATVQNGVCWLFGSHLVITFISEQPVTGSKDSISCSVVICKWPLSHAKLKPSGVKTRSYPASITVHQARYYRHISNMTVTEIRSLEKPAVTRAIHSTAFSIYANHKPAKLVNT